MRTAIALGLSLALLAAPATARADWSGCVVGPTDLNRCTVSGAPAAVLAALAVPVLVAGAAATVAHEMRQRADERLPDGDGASGQAPLPKRTLPNLALVPEPPPDPYRVPAGQSERPPAPSGAVRFNETATNVGMAVGGAMVLGAMIAAIVQSKHK